MKKDIFKIISKSLISVFLGVLLFSLVVKPAEVTITPLLDTPDNRTYYDELLESVKKAETSLNVVMATANYYPDYPGGLQSQLYDALVSAKSRGVRVRIVLDESNWSEGVNKTNKNTARHLRNRGLEVKFDDPEVTTHAKMIIVDKEIVFLGSSNWNFPTYTETYQSNIKLVSRKIARFYSQFFNALWLGETPKELSLPEGITKRSIIPLISTDKTRAYYETAGKFIREAEKSIHLLLFKIARYSNFGRSKSNLLTERLVRARKRGVEVRIILDVNDWSSQINQTNRETALWFLGKGVRNVKFDSPHTTTHSKILIVDGESVLIGSSNWSYYSLSENLEIDLAIKNMPQVAKTFEAYFEKAWVKADIPSREKLSGSN